MPASDALVDAARLGQSALGVDGNEGVVGRIERLNPRQRHLGQLPGADLLGAHRARQLLERGGAEVDVSHGRPQPADGESPATASARSMPIGMIIGAGMVMPLST
jgi:hypothetical protein